MNKPVENIEDDGYDYWIQLLAGALMDSSGSNQKDSTQNSIDVGALIAGRKAEEEQERKTKNLITGVIVIILIAAMGYTAFSVIKNS